VLRLASDDTQLWTHFDVMDNLLAQVTGRKRVVMWPPGEDERLYVEGSSSRVADIDRFNDDEFPMFRASLQSRSECELQPGDALFIPALWFHNTTSVGFSVGVNVFWRSHCGDDHDHGGGDDDHQEKQQQQQEKLYDRRVAVDDQAPIYLIYLFIFSLPFSFTEGALDFLESDSCDD
jgi:tRNA wybutosine-synthesizing protein 5